MKLSKLYKHDKRYKLYKPSSFLVLRLVAILTMVAAALAPAPPPPARAATSETIGRYYNEVNDEETWNTNTDFRDRVSLTFSPRGSDSQYYLVMARAGVTNSSTSYYTEVQFVQDSTTLAIKQFQPRGTSDYLNFAGQKVVTLTPGTSYTFKIQYRTSNTAGAAKIRNARIMAFQVANYNQALDLVDGSEATTISTTFTDRLALTFTAAAADYLIIGSADVANATAGTNTQARIYYDTGATDYGTMIWETPGDSQYNDFSMMKKVTLTAASHTFSLEYATQSASSAAKAKNARLSAILLSDLGTNHYASETAQTEDETSTTSLTYVDKTSLTFTPSAPGEYLVIGSALFAQKNKNYLAYAQMDINGTSYGENVFQAYTNVPDHNYLPYFNFVKLNFAASSQTIRLQYHTNNSTVGSEAYMKSARIIALRLNNLQSYSDSGFNTASESFSTYGAAVYVRGTGYSASSSYRIAYYDNGASGGQWLKNTDTSSSSAGELTDNTFVPGNYPAATAGSWKAVVSSQSYSPPTNYNVFSASANVTEDTFTVNASAIPELPTAAAALALLGFCLGTYWWLRHRRYRPAVAA